MSQMSLHHGHDFRCCVWVDLVGDSVDRVLAVPSRNLEEQPLSLEYKNYNRTAEATAATPSSRTDIKMSGACAEPMSVRDDFQNRY
ncbi:hypothetical protein N7468_010692 [Penicillium chermesinum]|uniref:Uncharacterized protein n=1 Tax=Penicillium chermesinum TaxID=63820 RepID=A0A9W9T9Y8_9EURO|nr:uncharacterized protein N7468_010692 [Penicillium chermesinum]KAJ5215013.1 hypothetical protein N7468_010692 [Penicillium chermesinum]